MDPSLGYEGSAAHLPGLKLIKPEPVPRPGEEEVEEEVIGLYILVRAFYEVVLSLSKLQDWVHSELENKGYIEVDDEWYKRNVDTQE
jgi:hypothetical protein